MNRIQTVKYQLKFSQSSINSQPSNSKKRLGEILQNADLISPAQVELALQDQSIYQDLRIGEILVLRGWVKAETVDFFVGELPSLAKQKKQKPLGYYLKQAALLEEKQIARLLSMQNQGQTWVRLGKLVVDHGYLKQSTVDFFLDNLSRKSQLDSVFISKNTLAGRR